MKRDGQRDEMSHNPCLFLSDCFFPFIFSFSFFFPFSPFLNEISMASSSCSVLLVWHFPQASPNQYQFSLQRSPQPLFSHHFCGTFLLPTGGVDALISLSCVTCIVLTIHVSGHVYKFLFAPLSVQTKYMYPTLHTCTSSFETFPPAAKIESGSAFRSPFESFSIREVLLPSVVGNEMVLGITAFIVVSVSSCS